MKASVLFEQGAPLRVEELDLEAPREGEVLVRMAASGVCHSCLHAADGSWKGVPVPIVLGDEGAGVVEAVGPGTQGLQVGDHVNVVQGGVMVAAHPVIAVDLNPARLEHARALGATHGIDASREGPGAAIRAITRRGVDYAFVAVGDTRAVSQAIDALSPAGTCVLGRFA